MEELEVAIEAVKEAEAIVRKYYGNVSAVHKLDKSLTTKADIESEEAIRNVLKKRFPNHSILGEETGRTGEESDYVWIIDPLDGTTNYSFQNPFFDISLALAYKHNPIMVLSIFPRRRDMMLAHVPNH
jgi:histidinol-phosphatase